MPLTPMMKQYMKIKDQYSDALLLFRLGDFYELFFEDAITASRELEITLTGRDCGLEERAPMCGVPYHSINTYINKLITKGYKVAICEQVENPEDAKGIVKRDVVRVITPGTLIDTELLEEKVNNYLMCIYGEKRGIGLAYVDISTGELLTTEITKNNYQEEIYGEICKVHPKEIIYYIKDLELEDLIIHCQKKLDIYVNKFEGWQFEYEYATKQLKNHFNIISVEGLGFTYNHLGIYATGALIDYLNQTQKRSLNHLKKLKIYTLEDTMALDLNTRKNLELTETIREKKKKGSLLWVLDKTMTSMGGRMLRRWIEAPLLKVEEINQRLDAVEVYKEDILLRKELRECLKNIYDLERLSGKIAYGTANPRDLVALKNSLRVIPQIKKLLSLKKSKLIENIMSNINCHEEIEKLIESAILDNPPIHIKEGNIIKDGFNKDIDELRIASREGKSWISNLEAKEREKTGIKSLKIGYNKVFGYYIEVTKSNLQIVPDNYIRKQTLANCERFITPELKEMESKVLGAQDKLMVLEYQAFIEIRNIIEDDVPQIQVTAQGIAQLDAIISLAEAAYVNTYNKPIVNTSNIIKINNGRHPVVERVLNNNTFVANNTLMDQNYHEISIITGPNMAGKSTYMRQVALIVLMAQIGSFVPADYAEIGVVDKIFTRVGASDDLSQGQSTFMVEMSELANILNNATRNSLIILDEIGRGTSTFDGLSIAWAVIEYISNSLKCKTLFSTHYHELTELEGIIEGVKNYRIAVKEEEDHIVFLRKVIEGSADKSYGIQVAKLAGLPKEIINRSKEILKDLEDKDIALNDEKSNLSKHSIDKNIHQLDFTEINKEEIIHQIKNVNLMETTPIEALNILYHLHKKASSL